MVWRSAMRTSTTTMITKRSPAGRAGREVRSQRNSGGKEHLEPAGTNQGHGHCQGALQEDRVGSRGGGWDAGGGVSAGAPASTAADHSGLGCDRRSAVRKAGRAFLSRLLRTLLLSAALHLLRGVLVMCAVAPVEHRWGGRERARVEAHRATDSLRMARGTRHRTWGLGILSRGTDGLV